MQDKYHEKVKQLITKHGALGVNALSREIGIPLSTMQKYMERQTYFKKTANRKWDLPERQNDGSIGKPADNFTELIDAQLVSINGLVEMLMSQFSTAIQIFNNQKPAVLNSPPVAALPDIDKRLIVIDEFVEKIQSIFKKQKSNIPEELQSLLFNFDYIGLIIKEGQVYANEFLEGEVYEMLAGKLDKLSEDTIQILKDNQIGQSE